MSVLTVPGVSFDLWSSISATFPIILMSMVFQNIVPVVVKQLQYNRNKSFAAITLGSFIPLSMYTAWCYTCLGGGIDMNSCSPLITIFSIATLAGSSICTSMSLAEEFDTIIVSSSSSINDKNQSEEPSITNSNSGFNIQTVVPSMLVPLLAALTFGDDGGLTSALAIAGSFGSPILYGFIPALMAWRQRNDHTNIGTYVSQPQQRQQYLIPSSTLPLLGILSTGFVGQEILSRFGDFMAVAT
jgi:tyrosine-specific transport protein